MYGSGSPCAVKRAFALPPRRKRLGRLSRPTHKPKQDKQNK